MYGEYLIYIFISYFLFISLIIFGITVVSIINKKNNEKLIFLKKLKNENK